MILGCTACIATCSDVYGALYVGVRGPVSNRNVMASLSPSGKKQASREEKCVDCDL
jgi:Fe-S-cluster-containing dehydrogenase component